MGAPPMLAIIKAQQINGTSMGEAPMPRVASLEDVTVRRRHFTSRSSAPLA